jgi:ABC-type spermidine/putrescine transport system permease subunit I
MSAFGRRPGSSRSRSTGPMYGWGLLAVLLAPFVVLLGVGIGLPILRALRATLFTQPDFGEPYRALARDPVLRTVLVRTLTVAGLMTGVSLCLAYPTASFIMRAPARVQPVLLAVVLLPMWSSTVARTYGWVGIFVRNGIIDRVGSLVGAGPFRLLYTQVAVVFGMVHVLVPLLTIPIYAALRRYDQRLTQASLSLGAGRLRTFLRVKLPTLLPALLASSTAVFILALGFFETPALLGGPRSQLISNLIAQQIFSRYDVPRAQAMSLVFLLAVLVVLVVVGTGATVLSRVRR